MSFGAEAWDLNSRRHLQWGDVGPRIVPDGALAGDAAIPASALVQSEVLQSSSSSSTSPAQAQLKILRTASLPCLDATGSDGFASPQHVPYINRASRRGGGAPNINPSKEPVYYSSLGASQAIGATSSSCNSRGLTLSGSTCDMQPGLSPFIGTMDRMEAEAFPSDRKVISVGLKGFRGPRTVCPGLAYSIAKRGLTLGKAAAGGESDGEFGRTQPSDDAVRADFFGMASFGGSDALRVFSGQPQRIGFNSSASPKLWRRTALRSTALGTDYNKSMRALADAPLV